MKPIKLLFVWLFNIYKVKIKLINYYLPQKWIWMLIVILSISNVGTKSKSKNEFYFVLTAEGRLYLPPKRDWTQKFLHQQMIGKIKILHNDDVKVINVSQINELRVSQILLFARSEVDIDSYLSE